MKAEKVILSFVAVLVGLIAAGIAFYLYQATRTLPAQKTEPIVVVLSDKEHLLIIDNPKNEAVFDKKQITISGKTVNGAVLTVSTEDNDQVVKPAENGNFTLTMPIPDGTSIMQIVAVFPDGTEKKEMRTVTFSTESF
jgi:hypothetical protein